VWYCDNGHVTVAAAEPSACGECGSSQLERDPDVLDTWFSSALWPFATIGWPDKTDPRLEKFYPGDVLSTGRDIINLWVARMMMMGIEFMDDIPFSDVLIHSTVQAPDGRRMSKSLGTGIDPLELVDEFGADATRYGLLKMSSTQDVRFDQGAIEEGAKLANKLWNAVRFALGQAEDGLHPVAPGRGHPIEDRWIATRLDIALADILRQLEAFDFSAASKVLYAFVYDFCDWYIEALKPRLYGDQPDARRQAGSALLWVLDRILRMTHPMLPFVTEEIWAQLPGDRGLLMLAAYPEPDPGSRDDHAHAVMDEVISAVGAARSEPGSRLVLPTGFDGEDLVRALAPRSTEVTTADTPSVRVEAAVEDVELQRATLARELARAVAERDRARGMLANERFTSKAPPDKVDQERAKDARYAAEAAQIESRLAELEAR
jgi:valyl-tRNA synthetase